MSNKDNNGDFDAGRRHRLGSGAIVITSFTVEPGETLDVKVGGSDVTRLRGYTNYPEKMAKVANQSETVD